MSLVYTRASVLRSIAQANAIKFYNLAPSTAQKINKRIMQFWFTGILFSLAHGLLKVCLYPTILRAERDICS